MRDLSTNLISEKNKISSDSPWLVLLKITLNNEDNTTFRLVNSRENITFKGEEYLAFNFDLEPLVYTSKGEIPTVSLKVSNITRFIQPYLEELNGGIGSQVVLTVVNKGLLDEDYAELEETFDVLACDCDVLIVNFTIGAPSPMRRRMPLYRYITHCRWTGKFKGVECKYAGAETVCNGTLDRCRELNNTANYGGYTGLKTGGIRIVG